MGSTALECARQLKPKAKHSEAMRQIKATLYHEAIAALELVPDEVVMAPQFMPMGFGAVSVGQDRPNAPAKLVTPQSTPAAMASSSPMLSRSISVATPENMLSRSV